jgi:hypothetical protein
MNESTRWRLLAEYGAGYEADLAAAILEAHGIPVLRQGPEIGIFGPGFAGPTARGVELLVPEEFLEEARVALESTDG